MRTAYLDTIAFFAFAVAAISWLAVMVWYRRVARDFASRLKDDNDKPTEL